MTPNHKKLLRIYREEGLRVHRRDGRKRALSTRRPMVLPHGPNQRWRFDFVSDSLICGRRFRILYVVNDFSPKCLAPEADTSLSGSRVARGLTSLMGSRGKPHTVVSDNGSGLPSSAILSWSQEQRARQAMQNGFVQSFNGRLRDECLNETLFISLTHALFVLAAWRHDYNMVSPHSKLGGKTPAEIAGERVWRHAPRRVAIPSNINPLIPLTHVLGWLFIERLPRQAARHPVCRNARPLSGLYLPYIFLRETHDHGFISA